MTDTTNQPQETKPQATEPIEPAKPTEGQEKPVEVNSKPTITKVWSRSDVKPSFSVAVTLPKLYPDFEPWVFEFGLMLSEKANERREEYLSMTPSEMTLGLHNQCLDEVCDLLRTLPTGFGDLKSAGVSAGHSFRAYVETTTDPNQKKVLQMIVQAASDGYWTAIAPRSFRPKVQDRGPQVHSI